MEKFTVLLIIAAIVFALFSDQIDTAANGEKKVKKVILTFSAGVFLICMIAMTARILS